MKGRSFKTLLPPSVVFFKAIRLGRPLHGHGNGRKCSVDISYNNSLASAARWSKLRPVEPPVAARVRPCRLVAAVCSLKRGPGAGLRPLRLPPLPVAGCRWPAFAPVSGALQLKSRHLRSRWGIGDPGRARPAQAGHPPIGLTGKNAIVVKKR